MRPMTGRGVHRNSRAGSGGERGHRVHAAADRNVEKLRPVSNSCPGARRLSGGAHTLRSALPLLRAPGVRDDRKLRPGPWDPCTVSPNSGRSDRILHGPRQGSCGIRPGLPPNSVYAHGGSGAPPLADDWDTGRPEVRGVGSIQPGDRAHLHVARGFVSLRGL